MASTVACPAPAEPPTSALPKNWRLLAPLLALAWILGATHCICVFRAFLSSRASLVRVSPSCACLARSSCACFSRVRSFSRARPRSCFARACARAGFRRAPCVRAVRARGSGARLARAFPSFGRALAFSRARFLLCVRLSREHVFGTSGGHYGRTAVTIARNACSPSPSKCYYFV